MNKWMTWIGLFALLSGLFALLSGLAGLLILDAPLRNHQRLTLKTSDGAQLAATYYPGSVSQGVLVLEGFGSDQHMMRSIVRDLVSARVHVFTFDYSGHGYSPGALTYDNASTNRLAGQVQAAMSKFREASGLEASQITWMGHSLGARVALQSAVLGPMQPAKLVLIGVQVNLGTNTQAEFFTGTADADLDWVQALGPETPALPILLVSGEWDDILTFKGGELLMRRLCGDDVTACDGVNPREWVLLDRLVHNYEIFSPRALNFAWDWAFPGQISSLAGWRILLWTSSILGVFLSLFGLLGWVRTSFASVTQISGLEANRPRRLVWGKLWLWLVALPLTGLVMFLYTLIPLPSPTFNLIYGGFLGGYGLLMFTLYLAGRMPGATGNLHQVKIQTTSTHRRWFLAAAFNLALFAVVTLIYRSGLGLAPPVGVRFAWIFIFLPLTALGFWLGMLEMNLLEKPVYRVLAALNGLVPFYLYVILMGALGSTSGMLGALMGLLVLVASLLLGEINHILTGTPAFAALMQALFIFWMILPAGALFTPFFG